MLDIVFCALPYSNLDHIYNAPAILKGVAVTNGFKAKTVDFGCELLSLLDKDYESFEKLQTYFISSDECKKDQTLIIEKFYENCIRYFEKNPSSLIGLSVLSIFTHRAVFELCTRLKKQGFKSKIVVGGRGVKVPTFSNISRRLNLSSAEKLLSFGEFLKKRKLVDHVVIGDGEDAILNILENKQDNSIDYRSNEFQSSVPDYTDYNFKDYLFTDEVMLPVTGSKGCVRDCDFCDVKFHFGKYRYRTGEDIANELIEISNKFKVRKFQFTDSLVNGGQKPFLDFIKHLSDYNIKNPDKKITWNGQYICKLGNHPTDMYQLMKDSGAHGITIGAESGSNKVLNAMNKKTTVEALYEELENFRKYDITCTLLTFVGHWSETWDDFVEHCKMFIKITPYVRSGTISGVALGFTSMLLEGTPGMENHKINDIIYDELNPLNNWYSSKNPSNTLKERIYRRLIVHHLCKKLNIPTVGDTETLLYIKDYLNSSYREINEFFTKHS